MPLEQRRERYRVMIEALRRNDLVRWREEFIRQLGQGV
jgi:trehalose-6-phosphate synthase